MANKVAGTASKVVIFILGLPSAMNKRILHFAR